MYIFFITLPMITLTATFPVSPQVLYDAWLDAKGHSAMTGAKATGKGSVLGAKCSAWDGYITTRTIALAPYKKIVQSWRSSEFPDDAPDSTLTITFKAVGKKTTLTLKHSGVPKGQEKQYVSGWKEFYFVPMKSYFASL